MLELILALVLGCLVGIVTGLLPGFHVNTVSIMVLGVIGILLSSFSALTVAVFLIAMSIVHSFTDFIVSIFLGAPEAETALSVLPGHSFLLEGKGYRALQLTVVGGALAFVAAIMVLPLFMFIIKNYFGTIKFLAAPILVILSVWFIIAELEYRKIAWAVIVFLLAGILGLLALNSLNLSQPLFPLLSGLFGLSVLVLSVGEKERIPKQFVGSGINIFKKRNVINAFKAVLAGGVMSSLPTLGPAQAAVVARGFSKFKNKEDFLMMLGGINTVDVVFTLATLYLIAKPRSGVLVAIDQFMQIGFHELAVLLTAAFAAVGFAVYITLKLGRFFARGLDGFNYSKISLSIILFVVVLIWFFTGWRGLMVASVATAIGVLAPLVGIRRIHAMGVLIVPVVVYFV